jgi:hypothetical protein
MKFNKNGYLDAGLHDHDLPSVKTHFVDAFPTSATRSQIWTGYIKHCGDVKKCGVTATEFLNGSFATSKNDPGDIDMVAFIDQGQVNGMPMHLRPLFSNLFGGPATKVNYNCDAYFVATVPPGHPLEDKVRTIRKYWMGEFGFDRVDLPKGILRVMVG